MRCNAAMNSAGYGYRPVVWPSAAGHLAEVRRAVSRWLLGGLAAGLIDWLAAGAGLPAAPGGLRAGAGLGR
jgi:hypothetical protein